jgi:hypothetical protein
MPALPTNPIDRLASLEQQVQTLRSDAAGNRRRGPEAVARRDPWPAVTAEWSTVTSTTTSTTTTSGGEATPAPYDPYLSYPEWGDPDADLLPVKFRAWELDDDDEEVTWTDRSPEPRVKAVSPVGWLPPDTPVEVAYDGQRYQICESPHHLHGIACCQIPAATLTGHTWTLGRGTVAVVRETSPGVYEPQRWVDGTAVTMEFCNAEPVAIAAGDVLTAHQNADLEWIARRDANGTSITSTSSTSSTTTTTGACAGQGKWIWSAAGNAWLLDSDGCATATISTTSTSTTTGGSSTSSTSTTTVYTSAFG